jgi:hypothetical protein
MRPLCKLRYFSPRQSVSSDILSVLKRHIVIFSHETNVEVNDSDIRARMVQVMNNDSKRFFVAIHFRYSLENVFNIEALKIQHIVMYIGLLEVYGNVYLTQTLANLFAQFL